MGSNADPGCQTHHEEFHLQVIHEYSVPPSEGFHVSNSEVFAPLCSYYLKIPHF